MLAMLLWYCYHFDLAFYVMELTLYSLYGKESTQMIRYIDSCCMIGISSIGLILFRLNLRFAYI